MAIIYTLADFDHLAILDTLGTKKANPLRLKVGFCLFREYQNKRAVNGGHFPPRVNFFSAER